MTQQTELYDHRTERELIAILADMSVLDVEQARLALSQHPLSSEDFHLAAHGEIFGAATGLLTERRPVDLVAMGAVLKGNARVPPKLLSEILVGVPGTAAGFAGHVKTVRELALKRRALKALEEVRAELVRPGADVDAVLSKGASAWAGFTSGRKGYRSGFELILELMDELEQVHRGEKTLCIPTGVDVWDQVFGGLECGYLTFIGSQPSVGKGALFATWVDNLAFAGVPVGVFSLEDLATWLPRRHLAKGAGIPNRVLAKHRLTTDQMQRLEPAFLELREASARYFVDDRSLLTPAQIAQTARDWIINRGVKVILLDHLGKVDWEAHRHHRHDLAIEAGLMQFSAVAKEHKVPFVIACHMKRSANTKTEAKYQRPSMSDFALASWIERDARNAAGLYLVEEDPDVLMVANLKQTNGQADEDFPLRRLRGAAMVASENGRIEGRDVEAEEQLMIQGLGGQK